MERNEIIERIVELEWEMFTSVNNAGGRASCQDDKKTFLIMRRSQSDIWSTDTLKSYLIDIEDATGKKINLMAIKYAHMMEITFPDEYEAIKKDLPQVSAVVRRIAGRIMEYHSAWALEASEKYPKLFSLTRPVNATDTRAGHTASIDNYLKSELLTYSEATLELCLKDTLKAADEGVNLSLEILKNTAESYGFKSLEAIEDAIAARG